MAREFKTTPITVAISYENDNPLYDDETTFITIKDEGSGCFIVLSQNNETPGEIRLDLEELDIILVTAKKMIEDYKNNIGEPTSIK